VTIVISGKHHLRALSFVIIVSKDQSLMTCTTVNKEHFHL